MIISLQSCSALIATFLVSSFCFSQVQDQDSRRKLSCKVTLHKSPPCPNFESQPLPYGSLNHSSPAAKCSGTEFQHQQHKFINIWHIIARRIVLLWVIRVRSRRPYSSPETIRPLLQLLIIILIDVCISRSMPDLHLWTSTIVDWIHGA